mmetsp:Transcript_8793/g.17551  ORF Transcript_8793/g.17551 Transcript_8793/m.17551 type:complete len:96 (+) Transcript_8793:280-567(+)
MQILPSPTLRLGNRPSLYLCWKYLNWWLRIKLTVVCSRDWSMEIGLSSLGSSRAVQILIGLTLSGFKDSADALSTSQFISNPAKTILGKVFLWHH